MSEKQKTSPATGSSPEPKKSATERVEDLLFADSVPAFPGLQSGSEGKKDGEEKKEEWAAEANEAVKKLAQTVGDFMAQQTLLMQKVAANAEASNRQPEMQGIASNAMQIERPQIVGSTVKDKKSCQIL